MGWNLETLGKLQKNTISSEMSLDFFDKLIFFLSFSGIELLQDSSWSLPMLDYQKIEEEIKGKKFLDQILTLNSAGSNL